MQEKQKEKKRTGTRKTAATTSPARVTAGKREQEIAARMSAVFSELFKDPEVRRMFEGEKK